MSKTRHNDNHVIEPQPVIAADAGVFEKSAVEQLQSPAEETQIQTNGQDESNAPPDGGAQAWLQVVASFMLYFNHLYAFAILINLPRVKTRRNKQITCVNSTMVMAAQGLTQQFWRLPVIL
jgi:hypothetical protein